MLIGVVTTFDVVVIGGILVWAGWSLWKDEAKEREQKSRCVALEIENEELLQELNRPNLKERRDGGRDRAGRRRDRLGRGGRDGQEAPPTAEGA